MENLSDLKKTYQNMKKKGNQQRIDFLNSIVLYCKFIGFSYDQTMLFLGVIRNCVPGIGQSWNDTDDYDEIDVKFNIETEKTYNE